MLELRLHYKPRKGAPVLYLGWFHRLAFLTLAILLTTTMVLVMQYPIPVLVISTACLLGAMYHESWSFDTNTHCFVRSTGFLFWSRKLRFEANHVIALHFELYRGKSVIPTKIDDRGQIEIPEVIGNAGWIEKLLNSYSVGLYLVDASKGKIRMERHRLRKKEGLLRAAKEFADFAQVRID